MNVKCACLNNAPVRIKDDERGGERYECYYCKFKWRYLEVHNTICKICDEHGINLKNPKCTWCGSIYDKSDYAIKKVLALW